MVELRDCTTNFFPELCGINVIVDPQSNLGTDDDKVVILGKADGTAIAGNVYPVTAATRADLFGESSMLNRMIDEFYRGCPTADLCVYVVDDHGTTGTGDIEINLVDAAAQPGVIYVWVNGQVYSAAFDPAVDTNDTLAANLANAIDADPNLTVTVSNNEVSLETVGCGEIGGFLDIRTEYNVQGQFVSSPEISVNATVTSGTGTPDLSGFAALTEGFEFVINPYTDPDSMGHVETYLCGQWSGGVNSRAYGVFYGDASAGCAFAQNSNNALASYMGINGGLTPPYLETAAFGCLAYSQLNCASDNISASMTGQRMAGMLAPEVIDRFTDAEKEMLVECGLGYFNVNRINDVIIGRAVTTYTVRDNGSLDDSLRDINKPAMIACLSKRLKEELFARFAGYAFRNDGIVGGNSTNVATVAQIENFIISIAQGFSNDNLIQNIDGFTNSLIVEFDPETGCISIIIEAELVCPLCCVNVSLRTI
jgi:phage tail sheath gpL-like